MGLCGGGMAILSGSVAASGETSRLAGSSLEMDLGDGGRAGHLWGEVCRELEQEREPARE